MRIHRLSCGTLCPLGRKLLHKEGRLLEPGRLTCICLLIETPGKLVLVDTGFGTKDLAKYPSHVGTLWPALMRAKLTERETAVHQVRALGYRPEDVSHIVCTHLDFDHAGGLADFPSAEIHVSRAEFDDADTVARHPWKRRRYVPDQWAHAPKWSFYPLTGEKWFGFDAVRTVAGLGPAGGDILLVPLLGHSAGHCGVAIRDAGAGGKWLLHAGDAYFNHLEVDPRGVSAPPGVKMYQTIYQKWRGPRLENQRRLRDLLATHAGEVDILCSHDPFYFDGNTKGVPLGQKARQSGDHPQGRPSVT